MLLWFVASALLGLVEHRRRHPDVLRALDPLLRASRSSRRHGCAASSCSGAVVLAVTGAEALYADMGHFGRRPIRLAWLGARAARRWCSTISARARCCSRDPEAVDNPFYHLRPGLGCCYPMVGARDAWRP